jgi:hypothetical protein
MMTKISTELGKITLSTITHQKKMETPLTSATSLPTAPASFPPPALIRAASLLADPVILDWAIHYLDHASRTAEEKQLLAPLWFSPGQMQALFAANEPETLVSLLNLLPAAHFLPHCAELAACWQSELRPLCFAAAKTLSQCDPALAAQAFTAYLDSAGPYRVEYFAAIATSLPYLAVQHQVSLLDKIMAIPKPEHSPEAVALWQKWGETIQRGLFQVALQQQHGALPDLWQRLLTLGQAKASGPDPYQELPHDDPDQEPDTLAWLAGQLFGHTGWANLCLPHFVEHGYAGFADLATLLHEDAPIAEMDRILQMESPSDAAAAALALLAQHRQRVPDMAWSLLQGMDGGGDGTPVQQMPLAITVLALAAIAAAFERTSLPTESATLAQLLDWLAQDIETNRHQAALVAQIRRFPRADIVAAVQPQFYLAQHHFGCFAMVDLVGELGWPEFIPLLLGLLGDDDENDPDPDYDSSALYLAASRAMLRIAGAPTAIMQQWDELNYHQQLWASEILPQTSHAVELVDFLLPRLGAMLRSNDDVWYEPALLTPDVRLIDACQSRLSPRNWRIEHCFYCASRLLDLPHPKLDAIQKTILQDWQRNKQFAAFAAADFPHEGINVTPRTLLAWEEPARIVTRPVQVINQDKVGRNDPCSCGSGKKYKKCCMP